ncbi:MAG: DUF4129 domain-containing protein, partial [Aureliella sp.]
IFFLIVAFYRGQYDSRLMYIFGLYTVATVLIARIAIDSGRAYANAFSLPLAVVSIVAMLRFVTYNGPLGPLSWIVNVALLAVAWYLADRITFDCTQISDRERSVQQGLLQSLGMLKPERVVPRSELQTDAQAKPATNSKRRARKHNPGVWVLYFALLAIPLFGLGQLAIPAADQRSRAFVFLIFYLACALSLLVLTSLVGMRRYLRQRGVAMPAEMSTQWMAIGVGSVMLLLLLCLALPLPGRSLGLVGLPSFIKIPKGLSTSRWGWGKEGTERNNGAASQSAPPASEPSDNADAPAGDKAESKPGKPGDKQSSSPESRASAKPQLSDSANSSSQSQPEQSKQSEQQQSEQQQSEQQQSEQQQQSEHEHEQKPKEQDREQQKNVEKQQQPAQQRQAREQQPEPKPAPKSKSNSSPSWLANLPSSFAELFKWLTLAVLAIIIVAYLVTHPGDIARLWRELQAWWAKLWGGRSRDSEQPTDELAEAAASTSRRPFASFANPFAGQLGRWSPADIVVHSFAAFEAWAAERGRPRRGQETAAEFARQAARGSPAVATHAQQAAQMLDQLMFAGWQPQLSDVQPLAELWRALGR